MLRAFAAASLFWVVSIAPEKMGEKLVFNVLCVNDFLIFEISQFVAHDF